MNTDILGYTILVLILISGLPLLLFALRRGKNNADKAPDESEWLMKMETTSITTENLSVTLHWSIHVAKIYEYGNVKNIVNELESISRVVNIYEMVGR